VFDGFDLQGLQVSPRVTKRRKSINKFRIVRIKNDGNQPATSQSIITGTAAIVGVLACWVGIRASQTADAGSDALQRLLQGRSSAEQLGIGRPA